MAGYIGTQAVSVNTTSATISDDLSVGDDLTVTDDAAIGGTLAVTGVATFTATPVFSADVTIEDDLFLDSDSATIHFGEDNEVKLFHVNNVGLQLTGSGLNSNFTLAAYHTTDGTVPDLKLAKSGSNTIGTNAATANGEALGQIRFAGVDTSGDSREAVTMSVAQVGTASGAVNGNFTLDVSGDIIFDGDGADILFKDGGTEWLGFNSGGTMSAAGAFTLDANGDIVLDSNNGIINIKDGGTEFLRITEASGNATIESKVSNKDFIIKVNDGGTSTVALQLNGEVAGTMFLGAAGGNGTAIIQGSSGAGGTNQPGTDLILKGGVGGGTGGSSVKFFTAPGGNSGTSASNAVEKMRIDPDGGITTNGAFHFLKTESTTVSSMTLRKATNTDADNIDYLQCRRIDNQAQLIIQGTGNVVNLNNSYGATSDVKLKENIADASSQWDDIKAVKVRKYSFKTENADAATQIGVIAQELETAGMGGLVVDKSDEIFDERKTITDNGEQVENPDFGKHLSFAETVTKEVKYSVLYMKSIKALQEAMTRIETLETKVTALEG